MDHDYSVSNDKQYWIHSIVGMLQLADVVKLRCIYQFVLHIVK